jgi:hypothetical protein
MSKHIIILNNYFRYKCHVFHICIMTFQIIEFVHEFSFHPSDYQFRKGEKPKLELKISDLNFDPFKIN